MIKKIEEGYHRYHDELDQDAEGDRRRRPRMTMASWRTTTPFATSTDSCQELLRVNKASIERTAAETERFTNQAHLAMLLLGALGPLGGLVIGYMVARGLSRSIYSLSVHVQDMARHLDQEVASSAWPATAICRSWTSNCGTSSAASRK